jgi:hypothetical protein
MAGELEAATAVASLVLAVLAVLGYLANRKQFQLLSKAVDALVKLAEGGRRRGRKRSTKPPWDPALREREVALKERKASWDQLVAVGKALGWAWDRGLIGGDDEEDDREDEDEN